MKTGKALQRKKAGRIPFNKKRILFLTCLILLLMISLGGMRFLGSFKALQNSAPWAQSLRRAPREKGINYLFYGLRENGGELKIEEMFLLNFSSPEGPFHTIFIPGEILLHLREREERQEEQKPRDEQDQLGIGNDDEKILKPFYTPGHFYSEGGAELLIEQISLFLGIPVHHYIEVNYSGIPSLVDSRGGISYKGFVIKGQDYFDYFLHGDGKEEEPPLDRALRRVSFIGDIIEFLGERRGLFNLSRTIKEVSPYFETDLSWKELKEISVQVEPFFDPQNMVVQLPGSWRDVNGDSFFEPHNEYVAAMMENLGKDFILPRQLITVEVLNGCGVAGIAARVGEMLREEGFQVANIDNADSFDYPTSRVISRLENVEPAREIAQLIPGAEFFKEPAVDYPFMVTVIIGKNFPL